MLYMYYFLTKRKELFRRPNIYVRYANFLILINHVKMLRNAWKKDFKNVQRELIDTQLITKYQIF